jgi:uncharacterized protein (DUF305 family)
MHLTRDAALAAIISALAFMPFFTAAVVVAQDATPTMTYSCETATAASPMAGMEGMMMGTPAAGEHDMAGASIEFDQLYIDMMIPHHQSIIALAQAAQERLSHERLFAIAENIISSQQAEIEELKGYREQWYGSRATMPMDGSMMDMMDMMMQGMGDMQAMAAMMDADALVAAFCAGEDADLTFIDLAIPHHQMAVMASQAAREQATHEEIREVAERVIQDQQREIDELQMIRSEGTG